MKPAVALPAEVVGWDRHPERGTFKLTAERKKRREAISEFRAPGGSLVVMRRQGLSVCIWESGMRRTRTGWEPQKGDLVYSGPIYDGLTVLRYRYGIRFGKWAA